MWASDDSVLGSIERSNAHLDQILHRSGIIFLIRSYGKILLQSRSSSSATFPGRGILPALSMSRSENPTNRQQDVNSKKRRESQLPHVPRKVRMPYPTRERDRGGILMWK